MTTAMLLCVAMCCAPPAEGNRLSIQADDDPTRVVVRYRIPEGELKAWEQAFGDQRLEERNVGRFLSLRLVPDGKEPTGDELFFGPGILGTHELKDGVVSFRPKFALARGASYLAAAFQPPEAHDRRILARVQYDVPPLGPREPTEVVVVSPPADEVPANLLKFSIFFSRPMREGKETFEHIHLLDDTGKEIPHPWRDIELWTFDGRQLSLYIHPGRIKQGVNLREELGPVLMPGRSYTLVIDGAMRDVTGAKIGKEYRKTFKTGPELHKKIDVASWKITAPKAGTLEPLVIEFDREFDYGSIYLSVFDQAGKSVTSSGRSRSPSSGIEQLPHAPWKSGTYRIVVDPKTTDLAGNTPHTVFDRDLDDRSHDPTEGPIERTFTIR